MNDESQPTIWWLTVATWLALAVFATTTTLISVSLKRLGADLDIDLSARGTLALIRAAVLAVFALVSGVAADRVGKKWLITGAMFLIAGGLVLTGLVDTYAKLLVVIAVVGMGLGCVEALVSALIAQLHPRNVESQMSVLHAWYPVGIVASSLAIGAALDEGVAWQTPFVVVAAPAALVGLMFAVGRYDGARRGGPVSTLRVRQIVGQPAFWFLAAAMLFGAGAEGALAYWTPNFIQAEYATKAVTGAFGLTLFSAAMAAGRFGLGALTRFVSQKVLFFSLLVLGVCSTFGLGLTHDLTVTFVLLTAAGVSVALVWPGVLSMAAERISAGSATLFAMLSAAGVVGFGVLPQLLGVVAERFSLRGGLLVVPVSLVVMALALLGAFLTSQVQPAASEDAGAGD